MQIRSAGLSDLDALLELYGQVSDAMEGTPFDVYWRRGAYPAQNDVVSAVYAGEALISEQDGQLAAAVVLNGDRGEQIPPDPPDVPWLVDCPSEEVAYIHLFVAAPTFRGTGAARALLLHVIDTARAQGMHTLRLGAALYNIPAVRLYEGCGFRCIMEVKKLYGSVEVDAGIFELPL